MVGQQGCSYILGSTKTFDELESIVEVMSILHAHHALSPRAGPPYSIGVEDAPVTKDMLVGNVLPTEGDGAEAGFSRRATPHSSIFKAGVKLKWH